MSDLKEEARILEIERKNLVDLEALQQSDVVFEGYLLAVFVLTRVSLVSYFVIGPY